MTSLAEIETSRLQVQAQIDEEKDTRDSTERNRLGQFATPPALADDILVHAKHRLGATAPVSFLDPALGTGSFYAAFLRAFPRASGPARGYEIDERVFAAAQELWAGRGLVVENADFTRATPPVPGSRANLLICNPPYVRHHHLNKETKARLHNQALQVSGADLSGLSGLYCYFLCLCHEWMAKDGLAAWLIPSEFMDVNYGSEVKRYLLDKVTLERIHRFDPADAQFADALVSSVVVWIRNTPPSATHEVEFTYGGSHAKPTIRSKVPTSTLRASKKWTRFPVQLAASPPMLGGTTLSSLFKVKRGLATGNNDFFVLEQAEAKRLGIPSRFLQPLLPPPRDLKTDRVKSDENGLPVLPQPRFLLSCDLDPEVVRRDHPALWAYLETGRKAGVDKGYLCSQRDPWYAQERRPPAPLLCTYMGRSTSEGRSPFRFVLNESRATATNSYLMLYPKDEHRALFDKRPDLLEVVWKRLSSLAPTDLTDEGRVYGGGLHKLEPKELGSVRVELPVNVRRLETFASGTSGSDALTPLASAAIRG